MQRSSWGLVALLATVGAAMWVLTWWTARGPGGPTPLFLLLAVAFTLATAAIPWLSKPPSTYVPRRKVNTCPQCGTLWHPNEGDGGACPACGPVSA